MFKSRRSDLAVILAMLDQAYNRRSWHGTNLRGAIRRISAAQASWRPAPARHNIWEIVVHAAYWKYAVWRRLTGGRRGSFPYKGANWFRRPADGTGAGLRADIALLDEMHRQLRAAATSVLPRALHANATGGGPFTNAEMLSGAAAHDLYHAGQIQLLKKLALEAGVR